MNIFGAQRQDNERNTSYRCRLRCLALAVALAGALALSLVHPQVARASCGGATAVSDAAGLNAAINSFNSVGSGPCEFTIQIDATIALTQSTTPISNTVSSVSLAVDGNGYSVDGQNFSGVRPFEIFADTLSLNKTFVRDLEQF